MIGLGIVLTLAGAFLLVAGVSSYRNATNQTMPLIFRSWFQSLSKEMGIAFIVFGGVLGVAGIGVLISHLLP